MNLLNKTLLFINLSQVYDDNRSNASDEMIGNAIAIGIFIILPIIIALIIYGLKHLFSNSETQKENTTPAKTTVQDTQKETVTINYCPNCGQKLNKNQNFCPNCGKNVKK